MVAYVPSVMFSGPVARGFETSAMPLHTSIAPRMPPVLHIILLTLLTLRSSPKNIRYVVECRPDLPPERLA